MAKLPTVVKLHGFFQIQLETTSLCLNSMIPIDSKGLFIIPGFRKIYNCFQEENSLKLVKKE